MVAVLESLKEHGRRLKADAYTLYLVARDPRTPLYAKLIVGAVVAYAFSPIDLIPDFIPVLGYLDDLLLLPLGIWIAIKLVPVGVMQECRARADESVDVVGRPSRAVTVVIVAIWLTVAALGMLWISELARTW